MILSPLVYWVLHWPATTDLATYCVCWKCLHSLHKHRLPGCVLPGTPVARLCYQLFLEQLSCCFWNAGDWIQKVHTLKLSYSLIQFSFHIHFTQTETKDQKDKRQCCEESLLQVSYKKRQNSQLLSNWIQLLWNRGWVIHWSTLFDLTEQ